MDSKATGVISRQGVCIMLVFLSSALAQGASVSYHSQTYLVDSRTDESLAGEREPFLALISVPDAPWLRVHFSEYNLGEQSHIILTSEDGYEQHLYAQTLASLPTSSAFVRGARAVAELHVAPEESGIFFRIEAVTVGEYPSTTSRSIRVAQDTSKCKACGSGEACKNGCGPDGWIYTPIGWVLDPIFEDSCNRHDLCYCYGYATYCVDRDGCDTLFLWDMQDDCWETFCVGPICDPVGLSLCIGTAGVAYQAVHLLGEEHWCCPETQSCNDYNGLGGAWACPAVNPLTVYVDGTFTGCPQHGTEKKPFATVGRGVGRVTPGGTLVITAGSYPENPHIRKNLTMKASGGTVVISDRLSLTTPGRMRLNGGELRIH